MIVYHGGTENLQRNILMWNKIGRIVTILADRSNMRPERALDAFYTSKTCERLHDSNDTLYLMGDRYVVDEFILETRQAGE